MKRGIVNRDLNYYRKQVDKTIREWDKASLKVGKLELKLLKTFEKKKHEKVKRSLNKAKLILRMTEDKRKNAGINLRNFVNGIMK